METTPIRPQAEAGATACPLDEDDPLLKDDIDDAWIDKADERICREFVRQLQQQESAFVTTNRDQRLANVRALDQLQRTLERIARRQTARVMRRSTKDAVNPDEEFAALERRLLPLLERAVADRDSKGLVAP
ncbi:MAG TPA: hypothetical protein VGB91_11385 [Rhizomicrobium sp.]